MGRATPPDANSTDETNFLNLQRYYQAYMDEDTNQQAGTQPLVDCVAEFELLWPVNVTDFVATLDESDSSGFGQTIIYLESLGVWTFSGIEVTEDDGFPNTSYIVVTANPNTMAFDAAEITSAFQQELHPAGNIFEEFAQHLADQVVALQETFYAIYP